MAIHRWKDLKHKMGPERRERAWEEAIDAIEFESGRQVASMKAAEFRKLLGARIDLTSFKPHPSSHLGK